VVLSVVDDRNWSRCTEERVWRNSQHMASHSTHATWTRASPAARDTFDSQ